MKKASQSCVAVADEAVAGSNKYINLRAAARLLGIDRRTLQRWITNRHFTSRDGLRRYGGVTRINLPTLQQRLEKNELMDGWHKGRQLNP